MDVAEAVKRSEGEERKRNGKRGREKKRVAGVCSNLYAYFNFSFLGKQS